jgi:hypothetical protein
MDAKKSFIAVLTILIFSDDRILARKRFSGLAFAA